MINRTYLLDGCRELYEYAKQLQADRFKQMKESLLHYFCQEKTCILVLLKY